VREKALGYPSGKFVLFHCTIIGGHHGYAIEAHRARRSPSEHRTHGANILLTWLDCMLRREFTPEVVIARLAARNTSLSG
jgi:hypothetical protein